MLPFFPSSSRTPLLCRLSSPPAAVPLSYAALLPLQLAYPSPMLPFFPSSSRTSLLCCPSSPPASVPISYAALLPLQLGGGGGGGGGGIRFGTPDIDLMTLGPTVKPLIMHPLQQLLSWLAVVGLVHMCNYICTLQWLASRAADIYKVRILLLKISPKLPTNSDIYR